MNRPVWAGIAVRFDSGALLTVQLAPVFDGSVDISRDYRDVRSFGRVEPTRYFYDPPEARIELHGIVTSDAHWSQWGKPPVAAAGELPGRPRLDRWGRPREIES